MNHDRPRLDNEAHRGSRIYGKAVLWGYDAVVLGFSNHVAWRCPTRSMLETYQELVSHRHLDVGVGTGWYLSRTELPAGTEVTLLDLHPQALENAGARIEEASQDIHVERVVANALESSPFEPGSFDSISTNYLLHCVPGGWERKGAIFQNLATALSDKGVLFGATILGKGVRHNLPGRALMALYNRTGIFDNREDDAAGLERALRASFTDVQLEASGTVIRFRATHPRR